MHDFSLKVGVTYWGITFFVINKPKMAYSRDLPKMARQQCGIMDCSDTCRLEILNGLVWLWYDYHRGGGVMTGMDDWRGYLARMMGMDDGHG